MAQAYYMRNPYPVPDVSREGTWISRGPVLGDKVSPLDRDWNVKLNAHERLFAHHTLSSIRKDRRFIRPQVWHSISVFNFVFFFLYFFMTFVDTRECSYRFQMTLSI